VLKVLAQCSSFETILVKITLHFHFPTLNVALEGSFISHLIVIGFFVGEVLKEVVVIELFLGLGRNVGLETDSKFEIMLLLVLGRCEFAIVMGASDTEA